MWTMLIANVLNVVANWALIFGHLGFPAMGLRGAGIATNAVRIFMLALLLGWVWWGRSSWCRWP